MAKTTCSRSDRWSNISNAPKIYNIKCLLYQFACLDSVHQQELKCHSCLQWDQRPENSIKGLMEFVGNVFWMLHKRGLQWPLGLHFQCRCSPWSCTFHSDLDHLKIHWLSVWNFWDKKTWLMSHWSPSPSSAKQFWTYHEVGVRNGCFFNLCESLTLRLLSLKLT